ncbi:hypothetical protein NEDG_01129 [Nematocida displodere]|uniref:RING-type domain-containing protein n=1 Tax=Nematocida displodere TaxID=1805483 RepID=A0A177EC76_9MICR|nr:hypothetical protein NEDG_01129 [Nematocida displodere]
MIRTGTSCNLGAALGKALSLLTLYAYAVAASISAQLDGQAVYLEITRNTRPTIKFLTLLFEGKSGAPYKGAHKFGNREYLLQHQPYTTISVRKVTPLLVPSAIPERLCSPLVFDALVFCCCDSQNTPGVKATDSLVIKRILSLFGTLNATKIVLCGLQTLPPHSLATLSPSYLRAVLGPTVPRPTLLISEFVIKNSSLGATKWLLKNINMSGCKITLTIDVDRLKLPSLEILDHFRVAALIHLNLLNYRTLDSLECKLLSEGRLPTGIIINGGFSPTGKVSLRIIRRISAHNWNHLSLPINLWLKLLRSSRANPLTIAIMGVHITKFNIHDLSSTFKPAYKPNLINAISLTVSSHAYIPWAPIKDLNDILEWVSRSFHRLMFLEINTSTPKPVIEKFFSEKLAYITTLPNLRHISVLGVNYLYPTHVQLPIICLALEACEDWTSGALKKTLLLTSKDELDKFPKPFQERLSQKTCIATEIACPVCMATVADLMSVAHTNVRMCVLDDSTHVTCSTCVKEIISATNRTVKGIDCPLCRCKILYPGNCCYVEKDAQSRYILRHSTNWVEEALFGDVHIFPAVHTKGRSRVGRVVRP